MQPMTADEFYSVDFCSFNDPDYEGWDKTLLALQEYDLLKNAWRNALFPDWDTLSEQDKRAFAEQGVGDATNDGG